MAAIHRVAARYGIEFTGPAIDALGFSSDGETVKLTTGDGRSATFSWAELRAEEAICPTCGHRE